MAQRESGTFSSSPLRPMQYWEDRARRYAAQGQGLAAVCSYGMPTFYNSAIQLTQRLALKAWLQDTLGKRILDVGCGVGRWSRWMAAQGGEVTGVDLSNTMVVEATRRAAEEGPADHCHFLVQDLAELSTGSQYDFILGVTVLQHILEEDRFHSSVRCLADHLAPNGRMVLIEAAPTHKNSCCDTAIFQARTLGAYIAAFAECGLKTEAITGVDPTPLKIWFLPYYGRLPRSLALLGLAIVTAVSLPMDAFLGRHCVNWSWHKLFVIRHKERNRDAA